MNLKWWPDIVPSLKLAWPTVVRMGQSSHGCARRTSWRWQLFTVDPHDEPPDGSSLNSHSPLDGCDIK